LNFFSLEQTDRQTDTQVEVRPVKWHDKKNNLLCFKWFICWFENILESKTKKGVVFQHFSLQMVIFCVQHSVNICEPYNYGLRADLGGVKHQNKWIDGKFSSS
jgi:hypothetical protein